MFFREFPQRGLLVGQRLYQTMRNAFCEDRLGQGIAVNASVAAELDQIRGTGRPLPNGLADRAGDLLRRDFANVRVHAGDRVDRLTARFRAAAFCAGNDIFLDSCLLCPGGATFAVDALFHELAHIANVIQPETIRCWERQGHEELTVKACKEFSKEFDQLLKIYKGSGLTSKDLVEGLKIACSNMDMRHRVDHPLDTLSYLFGYYIDFSKIPIIGPLFARPTGFRNVPIIGPLFAPMAKGEGPRHGEGYNYTVSDAGRNIEINLKAEKESIEQAAAEFADDKSKHGPIHIDPFPLVGTLTIGEIEWVKSLANALHTAQDRASHREGRKNFGHCDPRVCDKKLHWEPDDPKNDNHDAHDGEVGDSWWICNRAAFKVAFNNSCEVIEEFLRRIGVKLLRQWKRKSTYCHDPGMPVLAEQFRHGLMHPHRPRASAPDTDETWAETDRLHHGCVFGERPGPLGREWPPSP